MLRRRRENHWAKPDLYINRFCRKKTLRFGEDCFMTSSWNLFFFSNQRSFTFLLRWTIIIINFPQLQEITLMIREDKTKKFERLLCWWDKEADPMMRRCVFFYDIIPQWFNFQQKPNFREDNLVEIWSYGNHIRILSHCYLFVQPI